MEIKKDMLISDILDKCPDSARIMMENGMHCVGCIARSGESLEAGCKAHGLDNDKIDAMVDEMNSLLEQDKREEE